ncbi:MAG: type II secretion system major pseudopilin GspG [Kiritimatiellia bacterium]
MKGHHFCTGFTLIELLVVVIIIASLAAMVVPHLFPAADEMKRNIAKGDIATISTQLKIYRLHTGRYPTTEEGLRALLVRPSSAANWYGPYLEKEPRDPWGREYQYRSGPGVRSLVGFDLWSLGPDPQNADDDVTNWGD